MNVLIVMPQMVTRFDEWYVYPMGIAYVSSALKAAHICNVFTLNLNGKDNLEKIIGNTIEKHDIDIIATGGLSVQYAAIKQVIYTAKRYKENIITMVGGGYITSSPELAMEAMSDIDIGMIGEGEVSICELVNALINNEKLDKINGIIYRSLDGTLKKTNKREPIKDLDTIAFPDYDGFDFEKTLEYSPVNYGIYNKRAAALITSRGCPYNCTFCFHPQGDGYRARSLDNVFAELDYLVERFDIKSVLILDELFGGNSKRLKEFCNRIKKYNLQWWVETRVQFATVENLQLMKNSGCAQILLGIENVNNEILESMQKHITREEIETALKNAYDVGISAPGVLIFGDPAENEKTISTSINWWTNHPEYNIMLTTVQVYPGSAIWNYAIAKGLLSTKEEQINHIISGCPKLNLTNLTDERFLELCKTIGKLNSSREVFIADAAVSNEKWNRYKLSADVTGKCARCGTNNVWKNVNILAEGGGAESFICSNCGQSHTNSFQLPFLKNAAINLQKLTSTGSRVALWGQGRKLVRMYGEFSVMNDVSVFYVDSSPAKKGHFFYNNEIHSPEELIEFEPDILVIAVGDANMIPVLKRTKDLFGNEYKNKKVYILGEMMNPEFQIERSKEWKS